MRLRIPIGVKDKLGKDVCIGDTLAFDHEEWNRTTHPDWHEDGPHFYTIKLEDGELGMDGTAGDIPEYCQVVVEGFVEGEKADPRIVLASLYLELTDEQQERFSNLFGAVTKVTYSDLAAAVDLCDRTIANNKEEA